MIKNLIKVNLTIGFRSYVYPMYILIGVAYGLMLMAFPERYHSIVVPIFLLFEPGLVGFMFVGTEIFAEKKDGTIGALAVTPIEWRDYIIAKLIPLSLLSIVGGIAIMAIGTRSLSGLPYVVVGVFLCSIVYTLLGIGISAKYYSLDDYFIPLLGVLIVSLLPFAHYHGYLTHPIWKVLYLIPSYPALYFFKAPFVEISKTTLAISGLALIVWSGIGYYFAKSRFYKYAVEGLR
ncbi:hypothetical protein PFDSM3638_02900 [Pyrococcus furiosus DSM 3638]|uniref:ABC transporter permease n=3 Tax=Pyrococcus furiosus TaxID=2261 RepID=A0A5C0XR12_PYRFU|nr:hypothetical protein [Pyrococcus furiosus]AAL80702.1 hypothetical protein PF0578 [Pyrococcus furiosus DSM 3638]AFN03371.1 hypothetical protein PFC_02020 [Pyrococcus furiosus COM1]QEK78284.1 hypothetical protein PFDSM3638_02900 [Pyrococcus furiosus DSM 3638]